MKIAVTGGSGAIGSYVCDELRRAGHEAWSLDRTPPRADVEYREVDLTSLEATRVAVRGADQIAHLAAIPDPYLGHPLEQVIGDNTTTRTRCSKRPGRRGSAESPTGAASRVLDSESTT